MGSYVLYTYQTVDGEYVCHTYAVADEATGQAAGAKLAAAATAEGDSGVGFMVLPLEALPAATTGSDPAD